MIVYYDLVYNMIYYNTIQSNIMYYERNMIYVLCLNAHLYLFTRAG